MPSVYKKTSPTTGRKLGHYYCFFRIPGKDGKPKQVHRSTGKRTKGEAEEAARQLELTALQEAGATTQQSAAIMQKLTEAGELAMKNKLNLPKAREILAQIATISGCDDLLDYSVKQWIDVWMTEKSRTTKPSTHAFYRTATDRLVKFLGDRANVPLDAITTREIANFRNSITDRGCTAKTANHYLKCLRSLFGDAVKEGALVRNPTTAVKTLAETDSITKTPFSMEEVARLVDSCPSADWKGLILFGTYTGLRLMDAATLKVDNIDLERNVVAVVPKKTAKHGGRVEIPLHAELQAHLAQHPISPFALTPLFPSLCKQTSGGRNGLSAQFKAIMKKAKVERNIRRTPEDGALRESASRTFHSFRHTFTTLLASKDVPEEVRCELTGHTSTTTHQKYTHHQLGTLRTAVGHLPRLRPKTQSSEP